MYVIRVKPLPGEIAMWLVQSEQPDFIANGGVYETAGKQHATTFATKGEAVERAVIIAAKVPELFMGRLQVQWVPTCGS